MTTATPADLVAKWAALARAVDHKLQSLVMDLDPDRAKKFDLMWPPLSSFGNTRLMSSNRGNAILKILISHCGGMPLLTEFNPSSARLALLPRAEIHVQLCALAIARRPGVLRCCVDKQARQSLQASLGSRLSALKVLSLSSQQVSPESANWRPMRWVCIGYRDWCETIAPRTPTIHRMVALSLPEAMLHEVLAAPAEPAEHGVVVALQRLETQGVAWPL
jgi:Bacterial type III secretion protein (HrpB4)